MRVMLTACCVLVSLCGTARADDTPVRKASARYTAAVLKQDKAALEGVLHKEYQGHRLIGRLAATEFSGAEAVAHWTDADQRFSDLETTIARVQVVGDTAMETGSATGTCGDAKSGHTFQDIKYTRVWMKVGAEWRLVYERF